MSHTVLDEHLQRISDDLSGSFDGDLQLDTVTREIYSTDASLYQIAPLGVAYPRHREDVITLAQYASEIKIPLIPRGAGSGLAGGAIGSGLIVDLSRYFTNIERVDTETVRVQTGVVRDRLNEHLRPYERYFAPDPSSTAVTTVGGMIGVDAAGAHAVRVGSTRDHVDSIEMVMADGTLLEAGTQAHPMGQEILPHENSLPRRVAQLLIEHEALIRDRQPALIRNCSGYHLRTVMQGGAIHLPRLLVGSEGTLGLFTAATLHTTPLPAHRAATLLLFHDLEKALEAVQAAAAEQPSACDLLDRRLLSLARDADSRFAILIPPNAEAAILVEQTGFSDRQVKTRLANVIAAMRAADPTLRVGYQAETFEDVEFLWSLPYRVVPLLSSLRGETRAVPIVEDIAVPPAELREFLIKAQKIFQKYWVTASLYAHAASGQIHFRPFLSPPDEQSAPRIEALVRELYEAALSFGGTVSGEHGNGLARTAFIRSQYGPLYRVFQQVKDLFDPLNILNPGKIISDDPHLTIQNFRKQPSQQTEEPLVPLLLNWESDEFSETVLRCNGCGDCRSQSQHERMCPFFRLDQTEEASPRSKANLMRAVLTNTLDPKTFSSDEAKQLADSCFNCKQCQLECPSNVNIPSLAIEAKAQCVTATGLSRGDWYLSRAHSFGKLGCRFSPLANWAIGHTGMRWLIEQSFGISSQRRLPRFARREFMKSAKDVQIATKPVEEVVYFVDHYVNYHDPELGQAFLKILEHNQIAVRIPRAQQASGMAMISAGDLDAARELAETNVRVLAEYAREGKKIICTEPTAALCLKYEYPRLLEHPDVELVAAQTIEAGAYLKSLLARNHLRTDFQELAIQLAYHTPCHLKILSPESPLAELLEMIPGLSLRRLQKGCSGMAGAFGLTAQNFERSLTMGAELIAEMQAPTFAAGVTECSSCRMQMEQQATVPTIHPLKLLAIAYGLIPDLKKQLSVSTKGLVISP